MARAKYGIDMTRQSPEESKNLILRSDINKTIYHPIVGKLGMIYYVVVWTIVTFNSMCSIHYEFN